MIKIENLFIGYNESRLIISDLNITFEKGDFCALIGPNGAGKSTLLKSMIGYIPHQKGRIFFDGKEISQLSRVDLAKKVSLIPQSFQIQFDFTVEEIILMGRFPYLGYFQNYKKEDYEIVKNVINRLELDHLKDNLFSQLSGGEQQRVIIGRALVQDTAAILLDEAFSHLDINHQLDIMELLSEINKEGKTIIMVSHNINFASEFCDRIVMLKNGKLIADGAPRDIVTQENLKKLYDVSLNIVKNPLSNNPNVIYLKKK